MTLKDELYKVLNKVSKNDECRYHITLNAESSIYKAHFPGHPITPGACQIEIAKELIEDIADHPMEIAEMKNAKYIAPIIPAENNEIDFEFSKIENNGDYLKTHVAIRAESVTFTKISLLCRARNITKQYYDNEPIKK